MLVHEALRMSPDRIVIGEVRGGEALDLLDAMNTGHPGSICTIHAESPRETLPRLVRLALRSPHAPRAETVMSEVANTVDLVLYAGIVRQSPSGSDNRTRRLMSVSFVSGFEGGRADVRDVVQLDAGGRWHRVGSLEAMPGRARAKLSGVCDLARLLDGFDA
jgi:pilus assembly protein CpaF